MVPEKLIKDLFVCFDYNLTRPMKRLLKEVEEPYQSCLSYMFGEIDDHETRDDNFCKITTLIKSSWNYKREINNGLTVSSDDPQWLEGLYLYSQAQKQVYFDQSIDYHQLKKAKSCLKKYTVHFYIYMEKLLAEKFYFEKKILLFEKKMRYVLRVFQTLGKYNYVVNLLTEYGNRLKNVKEFDRALQVFKVAEDVVAKHIPKKLYQIKLLMGDTFYDMGKYEESYDYLSNAENLIYDNPYSKIWIYLHLIRTFIKLEKRKKTYDYLERVETLIQRNGFRSPILGRYHRLRGEFMYSIGQIDEAISCTEKAIDYYKESQIRRSMVGTTMFMAKCLFITGQYSKGKNLLLSIVSDLNDGDKDVEMILVYELILSLYKSNNLDQVTRWLDKCQSISQETGLLIHKGLFLLSSAMYTRYSKIEKYPIEDSVSNLEKSISIFTKTKNLEYKGDALIELAKIRIAQNQPNLAMDYIDEAYNIYLQTNEIYKFFKTVQLMLELNVTYSMGIDDINDLIEDMDSLMNRNLDNNFLNFYYYYSIALYHKSRTNFDEKFIAIEYFETALRIDGPADDWIRAAFHFIDLIINGYSNQSEQQERVLEFNQVKSIIKETLERNSSLSTILAQLTQQLIEKKMKYTNSSFTQLLKFLENFDSEEGPDKLEVLYIEKKILTNYIRSQE